MVDSYYSDGSALLSDPTNPAVYWSGGLYYGSDYYFSVGKSTNSGASWSHQQFGGAGGNLYCMALDPAHPDTVYAGGLEASQPAIYRTINGGTSWAKLTAGGLLGTVNRMAVSQTNPNLILAATAVGIFRSTDFGSSFTRVATSVGCSRDILIDPLNANRVWVGTATQGVYQSTDAGATFSAMNGGLGYLAINRLAINPGSYLFMGTEGAAAYRWPLAVGIGDDFEAPVATVPGVFTVPNPALGGCSICFTGTGEAVAISIYDMQGRLVSTLGQEPQASGACECWWDGRDTGGDSVQPGIYLIRVTSGSTVETGRLVVAR
jgi:hypothetical protein